jgi:hypothetical protein
LDSSTGLPLEGVTFELLHDVTIVETAVSDAEGVVDLGYLAPAVYSLVEEPLPGFQPLPPMALVVAMDGDITINGNPITEPVFVMPETAYITVLHINTDSGFSLWAQTYQVSPGAYGPFSPMDFPGFTFTGMAPESAPASGTIAAGEAINIVFLYAPEATLFVTYDPNTGYGGSTHAAFPDLPYTILSMEAAYVMAPIMPPPYTAAFIGWGIVSTDTSPAYLPGDQIMLTGSITLYALFDIVD